MSGTLPRVKGVIVAAGYGTRFLPVTKTIPKEMLPLVDRPTIQFIVDEFVESGITDILVISSRRKKALEDYFDREPELEEVFRREGAGAKLESIRPPGVDVCFVRQQVMRGTADALSLCEAFTGSSPFVVAYPDDILPSQPRCSAILAEAWRNSVSSASPAGCSVLSVLRVPEDDISRYGVVDVEEKSGALHLKRMVEKPPKGTEPSRLISLGRYLYTPDLFPVISELRGLPRAGEFFQTEPINHLAAMGRVLCAEYRGDYVDVGKPMGFLKAMVDYALTRPDMKDECAEFIRRRAEGM